MSTNTTAHPCDEIILLNERTLHKFLQLDRQIMEDGAGQTRNTRPATSPDFEIEVCGHKLRATVVRPLLPYRIDKIHTGDEIAIAQLIGLEDTSPWWKHEDPDVDYYVMLTRASSSTSSLHVMPVIVAYAGDVDDLDPEVFQQEE